MHRGVRHGEALLEVRGTERPAHLPNREPSQVHPASRGAAGHCGHRPGKERGRAGGLERTPFLGPPILAFLCAGKRSAPPALPELPDSLSLVLAAT